MYRVLVLLFVFTYLLPCHSQNISGKVTESRNNFPLDGVNISLQNSVLGTHSSANGSFELNNLPGGKTTLVFSYVGYAEKTISFILNGDTSLTVSLTQTIIDGPMVTAVATRASERESAITFSSLDKKQLEERYLTQDIPELVSELPSTTFYSEGGNGVGYSYLSMRGFGQRRISVLVNGIPQNEPEDHNIYWVDLPDLTSNIQSIQVQRGAGNAFYGPAAIGGSINIITDHFSPERKITVSYGLGTFNTRKSLVSINSGLLNDRFILYGRISSIKSDGYRDRAWVDFQSYFLGAAYYGNESSLRLHFYGGPIEDGLVYNGLPKFFNSDSKSRKKNWSYFGLNEDGTEVEYFAERRSDEIENFNQPHLEVLHEVKLSENLILNNNLFYINGYGFFDYDGSWGWDEYFRLTPEFGYSVDAIPQDALIRAFVDNTQYGWLPQMTIQTDKGDMILGAELRYHRSLHWGRLQKGTDLPDEVAGNGARRYYQYEGGKDIISLYFHQNYQWFEDAILQADLQYAYKKYHIFNEKYLNTDFSVPYNFINPRIGVNYKLSPDMYAYFSVYSTQREPRLKNLYDAAESSGGAIPQFELNADSTYNFDKPLVKPETLTGIEFGVSFSEKQFSGTANVYYMDFKDEIINKGGLDRFGQPVTGNADRTTHLGLELSGTFTPVHYLSFSGNVSFSSNKLKSYKQFGDNGEVIILDGNPIAGFPDLLGNLRVTYNWQNLLLSLSAKYVGELYTDNFKNKQNKVDAFSVFNFDFNYRLEMQGFSTVTLKARVSNIFDTYYMAYGEGQEFFPAAGRSFYTALQIEL